MTYKIEFYENEHGESEIWDFLEQLRKISRAKAERDDYIHRKEREK